MLILSDDEKYSLVKNKVAEIIFHDKPFTSLIYEDEPILMFNYDGGHGVYFELEFVINNVRKEYEFFLLFILKGKNNQFAEAEKLCDFFAWAKNNAPKFNEKMLHLENHEGTYSERLEKTICYIDSVLKSPEFNLILDGKYWDFYMDHWSPIWEY